MVKILTEEWEAKLHNKPPLMLTEIEEPLIWGFNVCVRRVLIYILNNIVGREGRILMQKGKEEEVRLLGE